MNNDFIRDARLENKNKITYKDLLSLIARNTGSSSVRVDMVLSEFFEQVYINSEMETTAYLGKNGVMRVRKRKPRTFKFFNGESVTVMPRWDIIWEFGSAFYDRMIEKAKDEYSRYYTKG